MVYKCSVCGYLFDEEKEGKSFSELTECPLCKQPVEKLEPVLPVEENKPEPDVEKAGEKRAETFPADGLDLSYPKETRKTDSSYRYMKEIHEMAVSGKSAIEAMGTQMKMPGWDDILVMGAQLNPMPLEEHAEVSLQTVIGKRAKKPMVLDMPVYISHMSLGALSREPKIALAKGSAAAGTAM
ncbi:MAG: FMN-binding glutamate synthase family protein, partial [Lachnospiraceae bacterium]|nr:FMN-binding glutamate synthase family protein [Lachnospiraceae bacterium]